MNVFCKAGLAAVLLSLSLAAPARAQLASHPSDDDYPGRPVGPLRERDRRGIYLGAAIDGGFSFISTNAFDNIDSKLSYGGQLRLGFSFNRSIQLYLAGAVHNASYTDPTTGGTYNMQLILTTLHVHHFIFQDRTGIGIYYDGGLGLGIVHPGFFSNYSTAFGLGYSAGLGVEIPMTRYVSLAPEFFFRSVAGANTDNNLSGTVSVLGLQLGVVYY